MQVFYTSIHPKWLKKRLFFGIPFAVAGVLVLLAGSFSKIVLENWGSGLFLLSFALIAFGLIPYRRLKRVEENPQTLVMSETALTYRGVSYPLVSSHVAFYENRINYGIVLTTPLGKRKLPFFSLRTVEEIQESLDLEISENGKR